MRDTLKRIILTVAVTGGLICAAEHAWQAYHFVKWAVEFNSTPLYK